MLRKKRNRWSVSVHCGLRGIMLMGNREKGGRRKLKLGTVRQFEIDILGYVQLRTNTPVVDNYKLTS